MCPGIYADNFCRKGTGMEWNGHGRFQPNKRLRGLRVSAIVLKRQFLMNCRISMDQRREKCSCPHSAESGCSP